MVIAGGLELEGMDQGLSNGILLGDCLKEFYDCKLVAEMQNDYNELRVTSSLIITAVDKQCTDRSHNLKPNLTSGDQCHIIWAGQS